MTRFASLAFIAALSASSLTFAQYQTTAAPAPTLVPAQNPIATQRLLILPFSTLNVAKEYAWIGKAVQEQLIAELGKNTTYSPIAAQASADDNAAAVLLAQQSSTPVVLRGSIQQIDNTFRFTAQLIDASNSNTLATASATGQLTDIFKVEDDLANQLRNPGAPSAMTLQSTQTAAATPAPALPPIQQQLQQPQQPTIPVYTTGYQTPSYTYAPSVAVYTTSPTYYTPAYYPTTYYYPAYSFGYGGYIPRYWNGYASFPGIAYSSYCGPSFGIGLSFGSRFHSGFGFGFHTGNFHGSFGGGFHGRR